MSAIASPEAGMPAAVRPWSRLRTPGLARPVLGCAAIAAVAAWTGFGLDLLTADARIAIAVFAVTLIAWVVLDLPETPVALAGALALVLTGVVGRDALFETFGDDIVWLMLAAFVIAAVLRKSGTTERIAAVALARCRTVAGLFWAATPVIAATAFVIPSTSARAAILLPVFVAAAAAVNRPRVTTGLALLFPTVILLSAAASITGAGAHLVAADFMARIGGVQIGFTGWALLAAPFALLTCLAACGLILAIFLRAEDRAAAPNLSKAALGPTGQTHTAVGAVAGLTVIAFATTSHHGLDLALVALIGALVAASKAVSGVSLKEALKSVEWNLLLFLAATLVIGEGLLTSGAAQFMVDALLARFDPAEPPPALAVVTVAAAASALSHLVVNSRTARAAILVPALALPLSAYGVDPVALIFLTAVGSGFCQTLMVSAKPIAVFAAGEGGAFDQRDLVRLAVPLLPVFVGLLVLFSAAVWPRLGLPL